MQFSLYTDPVAKEAMLEVRRAAADTRTPERKAEQAAAAHQREQDVLEQKFDPARTSVKATGPIDDVSAARLEALAKAKTLEEALALLDGLPVLDALVAKNGNVPLYQSVTVHKPAKLAAQSARFGHADQYATTTQLVFYRKGGTHLQERASFAGFDLAANQFVRPRDELSFSKPHSDGMFAFKRWYVSAGDVAAKLPGLDGATLAESIRRMAETGLTTVVR